MAVEITFGSYAFSSSVERYAVTQKPRTKQIVVPRRDGVRMDIPPLGPIEIRLSGRMIDTTQTGLRSQFDSLKSALLKKRDRLTLFDDRFVDVLLASYGDDFVSGSGMLAARYDLTFVGELPFLQSVALNSNSQSLTISPTTWSVMAGGNSRTRPTLRITNTSASPINNNIKLENLTLSKALVYTGNVAAGRTLVIDMHTRTITNDNIEDLTNWQGEFWELAVGVNALKYTGGVTVTIAAEWRDRWV